MFCSKCGNKVGENDKFCSKCGNAVTTDKKIFYDNMSNTNNINDYLLYSIFSIFFCMPLAFFAIYYSVKTRKELLESNIFAARNASKKAYNWMLASYLSVAIMLPIIGVMSAIAIPAFQTQINKSKDAEAIQTLGMLRSQLFMVKADLEGKNPREEDIINVIIGGEVFSEDDIMLHAKERGIDSEYLQKIEVEKDRTKGYAGYIICGIAKNSNRIYKKIPFKYVHTNAEDGDFKFEDGYFDSKNKKWSEY